MPGLLSTTDLASITATVASSLDTVVTWYRNTSQGTSNDGYGHSTPNWMSQGTANVNTFKPSASTLQAFAGIIGSSQALMMRFLPTTDIREGDRVVLNGLNWVVQNVQKAESYTIAFDALITVVT